MKRKITGTLLALLISGSSIVASASTVMGISSEYLPEIEEHLKINIQKIVDNKHKVKRMNKIYFHIHNEH